MTSINGCMTKINLGQDIIKKLNVNDYKNILVLTGPKNSYSVFKKNIEKLIQTNYYVLNEITSKPTENLIYNITNFARNKKIDLVLSVGGGSVMDCGRLISLLLSQGGFLHDYVVGGTIGGAGIGENLIDHITIPTISGTASEISPTSYYFKNNQIQTISSPNLFPKAAYIDPVLMTGVPKKVWANIAFDAFVHSLEAYVSVFANISSDVFAIDALKTYIEYIPKLLDDIDNIELINKIVVLSINSLLAINMSSVGAVHAIAHTLSAHFGFHHGTALALVCPLVCEQNYEFNKEKYDNVIKIMGGKNIKSAINAFIKKLDIYTPSISDRMSDDLIKQMSAESFNYNMIGNPKQFTAEEVENILKSIK